ncbi:MAG TPA: hypothetical protein VMP11_06315 [Verrucomicrobiae bacterium]|nr:hypothetical protein [Verrucomicrobiae bacterium]
MENDIREHLKVIQSKLEGIEKTLEEVRAQPKQEKFRKAFRKAPEITLAEVQSWKNGDLITLLVYDPDGWDQAHPCRVIGYRHDRLEGSDEEMMARPAHGFQRVGYDDKPEDWKPYEFVVYEDCCLTKHGDGGIKLLPADWDS